MILSYIPQLFGSVKNSTCVYCPHNVREEDIALSLTTSCAVNIYRSTLDMDLFCMRLKCTRAKAFINDAMHSGTRSQYFFYTQYIHIEFVFVEIINGVRTVAKINIYSKRFFAIYILLCSTFLIFNIYSGRISTRLKLF